MTRTILGIESSCDETAAAVVREDGLVLSDIVASQIKVHEEYGGVVPELAARAHLTNIAPVVQQALSEVPGGIDSVDAIAVTAGPGLIGGLLVGVQVGKALAYTSGKPLLAVDHLDGHLLSPYLRRGESDEVPLPKPYLALLASGGHTALYEVGEDRSRTLLGQTRDDAAGEAYDKAAKLLGLGYPGGPVIDRLAAKGDPKAIDFPKPMLHDKRPDFSFAGLKTAVASWVRKNGVPTDDAAMADVCASFQASVVEVLAKKSVRTCAERGRSHLVLTGGVAANKGLRARTKELAEEQGITLVVPPFANCTDNAAMIAFAGFVKLDAEETADLTLGAYSRDPSRVRGRFGRDGKVRSPQRHAGQTPKS